MIQFADKLWVGNSRDGEYANDFGAVLNVAKDLHIMRGWPAIEYAHGGVVDGPGNPLSAYVGAVMTLHMLLSRHERVLVHCHEGKSRSVSVALMYLYLTTGWDWDQLLCMISERNEVSLPAPHEAHREAYDRIVWSSFKGVMGEQ